MSEDQPSAQVQADVVEPSEDYVAPALTDLGSFKDLTQLGSGQVVDAEGMS
jgi:hypothetical protein